jgi:hypothetical protein
VVEELARGSALGTGWPSVLALIHAESGQREIARAIYERELLEATLEERRRELLAG